MKPFWVSLSRVAKGFRRDILIAAAILSIPFTMAAQTTDIKPDASNSDITYSASSAAPQPSDAPPQEEQYPTQSPGQGKLGVAMGPVNFRLYGTLLLNFSGSDNAVLGGDVPLWAAPGSGNVTFPDSSTGRIHDLFITARQTVVGLKISPSNPPASGWVPSATVEFDFFGTRPADANLPQGRVFDQPRLRVAYFELTKGTWKFVAGQDKVIIAPLDPISFSHVAIPLGATAGDLWGWLPQVRVEKTQELSEKTTALFQFGVLRPEFGDPRLGDTTPSGVSLDNSTAGTRSSMPFYQARIAISHPMNGSTATIGLGGHYGREVAGLTRHPDSWASALDFRVPLLSRLILRGESYVGSNLIPFQGGINQGVAVVVGTSPQTFQIKNIGDAGGWGELTFRATQDDKNHFYIGAGTDDPVHHDLSPGSTRVKNTFYWASYFRKLTNDVTMAMEWSNWQFRNESFTGNAPGPRALGKANVFNLSFAYAF
jgi:hypothetical protein